MKIDEKILKILLENEIDLLTSNKKNKSNKKPKFKKRISEGMTPPPQGGGMSDDEIQKALASKEQTESKKQEFKEQTPPPADDSGETTPPPADDSGYKGDGDDEYEVEKETYAVCLESVDGDCPGESVATNEGDCGCAKWASGYYTIQQLKEGAVAIDSDSWVYPSNSESGDYIRAGIIPELVNANIVARLSPKTIDRTSWVNKFPECVRNYNINESEKNLFTDANAFQDDASNFYQVVFYSVQRTNGYLARGIGEDGSKINLTYNCVDGEVVMTTTTGKRIYEVGLEQESEKEIETTPQSEADAVYEINNSLGISFACERNQTNCIALFINRSYELNKTALESINETFITWIKRGRRGNAIGQYYELIEHLQKLYTLLSSKYPTYKPYQEALAVANDTMSTLENEIKLANKFVSELPSMKNNLSNWSVLTDPPVSDMNYNVENYSKPSTYVLKPITLYVPKGIGIGKSQERLDKMTAINKQGYVSDENCKKSIVELGRAAKLPTAMKLKYAPDAEDKSWFGKLLAKGGVTQGGEAMEDSEVQEAKQTIMTCAAGRRYKGVYKEIYDEFFGDGVASKFKINATAEDAMAQPKSSRQTYNY